METYLCHSAQGLDKPTGSVRNEDCVRRRGASYFPAKSNSHAWDMHLSQPRAIALAVHAFMLLQCMSKEASVPDGKEKTCS